MKLTVLLYHALFDKEPSKEKYAIGQWEFERQMNYLSKKGFKTLLIQNLLEVQNSIGDGEKNIAITFDDGNYSDYRIAFPILRRYGFVGTFFVTVNWIGESNFVHWCHLKDMIGEGMSIQSHTLTHPFLSDVGRDNLHKELTESKKIIEKNLNVPVDFISLPGGCYSKTVLNGARDCHYRGLCNSVPSPNLLDHKEAEFVVLNRFVITGKTSFKDFTAIVNGRLSYLASSKIEHYVKSCVRKSIGNRRYYSIWSKFFRELGS